MNVTFSTFSFKVNWLETWVVHFGQDFDFCLMFRAYIQATALCCCEVATKINLIFKKNLVIVFFSYSTVIDTFVLWMYLWHIKYKNMHSTQESNIEHIHHLLARLIPRHIFSCSSVHRIISLYIKILSIMCGKYLLTIFWWSTSWKICVNILACHFSFDKIKHLYDEENFC